MFIWAARRVISKAKASANAGASEDLRMRAAMAFNLLSYVEITNHARVLFIASQSRISTTPTPEQSSTTVTK